MALVAHYRLDGNLSDALGKYNLQEYSNSGHILPTTDAIMGQAYYRPTVNNSPAYFATTQTIHLAGSHTLACWAKVTGVHSGTANGLVSYHSHADNTGSGITVREVSGSDYRISCSTGTGGSRTYHTYYGTSNIKDRWCHLVFRFDALENKISLWVNGQKEFETTYALFTRPDIIAVFAWSTTNLGSASYLPAAYIDDVRVYDHALSEREIRDIAQAMVLHYDFNQFQEPTVNLFNGSGDFGESSGTHVGNTANSNGIGTNIGGSWYSSTHYCDATISVVSVAGRKILRHTTGTVAGWNATVSGGHTLEAGKTYTASVWIRTSGGTPSNPYGFYGPAGYRYAMTRGSQQHTPHNWVLYSVTMTPDTTVTGGVYLYGIEAAGAGQYTEFRDYQLEEKPYPTQYTDGSRPGIIRDSSSQGSDSVLALATTPKWTEDGVIGKGCYALEFGKYFSLPKSTLGKLSSCTISFWRKRTAAGSWIVGNGGNPSGGTYFMATSGGTGAFYHSSVGSPVVYCDGVLSTTPANDDGWHHYCLVGADLSTWTYLNINAYDIASGTWTFRGLIDDLRIYATALSADEVMELYRQRASIDSQGNLVC